jgi:hypothetical protein
MGKSPDFFEPDAHVPNDFGAEKFVSPVEKLRAGAKRIHKLLVPVAAARCYASGIGGRRVRMRDGVSRLRGTQNTGEHND